MPCKPGCPGLLCEDLINLLVFGIIFGYVNDGCKSFYVVLSYCGIATSLMLYEANSYIEFTYPNTSFVLLSYFESTYYEGYI